MPETRYLRNCWYGLAWAEELESTPLLKRRILGMDLVVFRDAEGRPSALRDRCPHRFAPLSMGALIDGNVRCGYHGLQFNGAGKCVANPFGDAPERAVVRSFVVAERDRMLWIWPGDADKVDLAKIPKFDFHNQDGVDGNWVIFGYTNVKADYQLEADNLLDLSHTEFLHAKSFGGRGFIQQGEFQLHDVGEELHANWWMPGVPSIDPETRQPSGEKLDHFLDMRWNAPSTMRLHVGFLPQGQHADRREGLREDLPGQFSAHIITPEDDGSCHYLWSGNAPAGSDPFVGRLDRDTGRALFQVAFEIEDGPMLEAVEANMVCDFWDERPVILANDAGGIRARRRLAKLIKDEEASAQGGDPVPAEQFSPEST